MQLRKKEEAQNKEIEGVAFKAYPPNSWPEFWEQNWEPEVYRAILSRIERGSVYLDIGAWIGPHAIPAAVKGATVYAYEPDPYAYSQLKANADLNYPLNITMYPFAVHGSQVDKEPRELMIQASGDSETSCESNGDTPVLSVPFKEVLNAHKPDLVKIDVEGMELELLDDLFTFGPETIILAHHARMFPDRKLVSNILSKMGRKYDIVTVEGEEPTLDMENTIGEFILTKHE